MTKVYVSAIMNASIDQAWAYLRDFGALGRYHPYFENSYIEDDKPADQVGCVRRFSMRDGGGYLREQLLALDDDQHRCRYKILHIDADWQDYVAEMQLLPITEGNRCFGQWWAEWDVPADQQAQAMERVQGTFRAFFACVNAHYGEGS